MQNLDAVKAADVVICVTGMDGGLASVVAGLVEVPVIALPTSTGEECFYDFLSFHGLCSWELGAGLVEVPIFALPTSTGAGGSAH